MGVDPTVSQHEIGSAMQKWSRFQPGEGPSRGLLRDYEPSDGTFSSTTQYPAGTLHNEDYALISGPLIVVLFTEHKLIDDQLIIKTRDTAAYPRCLVAVW